MEAKGLQDDENLKMATLRNKRKRASSSSSYLEPAIANEVISAASRIGKSSQARNRNVNSRRNGRSLETLSSDKSDASMSQRISSPVNSSKKYERRSRHKTKEDRYVFKDATAHAREPSKEKKRKKSTRPARKEKTGSALLHSFAADNVTSDRLTLRPGTSLGLFTKGRASSPFKRGGLPDLSFSEVNFLSTRREQPTESKRDVDNSKRRRERKAADNDDEISRFFAVTKAPLTERDLNSHHDDGYAAFKLPPLSSSPHWKVRRYPTATKLTVAPVQEPIRPFLGFGERRPYPPVSSGPSSIYRASTSPVKPPLRVNPSVATSYFPWSTSPNNKESSPCKRTVSDLFRSSPGKKDQMHSRISESPVLRQVEHPQTVRRHKHVQPITANTSTAIPQKQLKDRSAEKSVKLLGSDRPDPSVGSANEAVVLADLPKKTSDAQTIDYVETAQVTDVADTHSLPVCSIATDMEKTVADASAKEQDARLQFASAVQELLDQWKDKVEIPVTFANDLRQSCTAASAGKESADELGSLQPVPQIAEAHTEPIRNDYHHSSEDPRNNKTLPIPSPTTIMNDHHSATPSEVIRPAPVASRGSVTKSQHSWMDSRIALNRGFARSPFGDSTYSTYRGTESIYEQQLSRSAPYSHYDRSIYRAIEHLDPTNHLVKEHDLSRSFEPLEIPAYPQHANEYLAAQHELRGSVYLASLSRYPEDYSTSVERGWPQHSEARQASSLGLSPGEYFGGYEYSASPAQTFQQEPVEDCTENIGYLVNPTRPQRLSYDCSKTQSLQSGEVEEPPVGFWKPNRLY
ncbi:hypothetical protein MMC11_000147 [Xylographa trunciseda]|nr:hypothetical protein [Xylographa trunciseda]